MAQQHLRVLQSLLPGGSAAFAPSVRQEASVRALGAGFFSGDLRAAVDAFHPTHAIIAAPVDRLAAITADVVGAGVRRVLIEKPAVLDAAAGEAILEQAAASGSRLWVGYNRRFYASVLAALDRIEKAGESISSVRVDFTERSHEVERLDHPAAVKARWVTVNSLHPIDLALHAVGLPAPGQLSARRRGSMAWHPSAAVMVGSGFTKTGVAVSYHANWTAPGGWTVEWLTATARYVFRPLEELRIERRGATLAVEPIDDALDVRFKPGLYGQCRDFLSDEPSPRLASYEEALQLVRLAAEIAGYDRSP
jgi:predicted dehydrogenase